MVKIAVLEENMSRIEKAEEVGERRQKEGRERKSRSRDGRGGG